MKLNTKNGRIHLRVSQQQKSQIQYNANALGLSLTNYILKMATDGRIVSVNSQSLAKELYALNCKLNENWNVIPPYVSKNFARLSVQALLVSMNF